MSAQVVGRSAVGRLSGACKPQQARAAARHVRVHVRNPPTHLCSAYAVDSTAHPAVDIVAELRQAASTTTDGSALPTASNLPVSTEDITPPQLPEPQITSAIVPEAAPPAPPEALAPPPLAPPQPVGNSTLLDAPLPSPEVSAAADAAANAPSSSAAAALDSAKPSADAVLNALASEPEAATSSTSAAAALDSAKPPADAVLNALASESEAVTTSSSAAAALDSAKPPADAVSDVLSSGSDAASAALDNASEALSGVGASAAEVLNSSTSAVTSALSDTTEAASAALGGVTNAVGGVVGDAGAAASQLAAEAAAAASRLTGGVATSASSITDQIAAATSGVRGAIDGAFSSVAGTASTLTAEFEQETSSLRSALDSTFGGVTSTIGGAVEGVTSTVSTSTQQVWQALPPPAQEVVGDAYAAVSAAVQHPVTTAVVSGVVGVPIAVRAYQERYGGYDGEVAPSTLRALLADDDTTLLVDIRELWEREAAGVLELRAASRYKAVALPLGYAREVLGFAAPGSSTRSPGGTGSVRRGVRDRSQLVLDVAATLVLGLQQAKAGKNTKFVFMDANGGPQARQLARAVKAIGGGKAFVLQGGFDSWEAAGQPIDLEAADYESNAIVVLSDEVSIFASGVMPVITNPSIVVPFVGSVALFISAAINYHFTLRLFGVWGLSYSLATKLASYESPQALADDVSGAVNRVKRLLPNRGPTPATLPPPSTAKGLTKDAARGKREVSSDGGSNGTSAKQEEQLIRN